MYFLMLVVALALLVGPIVAGSMIIDSTKSLFEKPADTMYLFQPVGLNNNDTQNDTETGTGKVGGASASSTGASTSTGAARIRLF